MIDSRSRLLEYVRPSLESLWHWEEDGSVVAWGNDYGKTRVFSTTIGHNNATVADSRYLELVTRGLLWACGKLDAEGNPLPGYGARPAKAASAAH